MSGPRQARSSHATSLDPAGAAGLGQEGLPAALRLLAAGHAVCGSARRRADRALLRAGGQARQVPAELAGHRPAVLALLPAAQALMEVTGSSDGLRATARRDGIWLEMSTISEQAKPTAAGRLAGRRLARPGLRDQRNPSAGPGRAER